MKKLFIVLMVSFAVFSARPANAQIISFVDGCIYWPGWGNGSSDNSNDSIGIPNFTGGVADVENNHLASLTINRQSSTSSYWSVLSPGDLFIDLGSNNTWDYVVDLTSWTVSGANDSDAGAGSYGIYSVNLGLNSTAGYILSGQDNAGAWSGYYIRDGHPVATNLTLSNGNLINFSGWGDVTTEQYVFNFGNLNGGGLDLGNSGKFTIGWTTNCANDVIYQNLNYETAPEPASLSLLGLGLLGLLKRKRQVKA